MTRRQDYTGPSWQQPTWYLRRIDRHHQLGHTERVAAAAEACRHTCALVAAHPGADPYDLAHEAIGDVRDEHQADFREPIPEPEPIDLDALPRAPRTQRDLKDRCEAAGPKEPSPSIGAA